MLIRCQCCGNELPDTMYWYICDQCNYRVCGFCLHKQKGPYGSGFKCGQCMFGHMEYRPFKD